MTAVHRHEVAAMDALEEEEFHALQVEESEWMEAEKVESN